MAFTCRYYAVPRLSYYKWHRRYEELGVDGLRDRSRPQEWEHFYNFERPHGALAGQTPYERLRQATRAPG